LREYREWIIGVVAYFAVFAVAYVASRSLPLALALGLVFGAAAGLLSYSLFPADPDLVKYQLDVRRRVKTVLADADYIADRAEKVGDEPSRQALLKASQTVRDLLSLAQEKDPGNIAQTTARVGVYIASVRSAVDAQLQIEAHPDYWANSDELLAANRQGFADFQDFALQAVQHLNQGEVTALRAKLKLLKPMNAPALGA
jgi:hypothetical protein